MTAVAHDAIAFAELVPGTVTRIELAGVPVALVRIDDGVYAVHDRCSHANVALSDGEVWCDEREIECPRHGSTFDLLTGAAQTLPATQPVAVYPVEIVDGVVRVTLDGGTDEPGEDPT